MIPAAPSPMTVPSRPREKGRQVVLLIAWAASQARIVPADAMASQPPEITTSARPERIIIAPWAMAWPDDEQALETAKAGPLIPNSIEMALTAALTITRGTVSGCRRGFFRP